MPNGIRTDRHERGGGLRPHLPQTQRYAQPVDQGHGGHAKPRAEEPQRKFAVARPTQPNILQKIAGHWVWLLQRQRLLNNVFKAHEAKEITKCFIPAQFLVAQQPDAQAKGTQQNSCQSKALHDISMTLFNGNGRRSNARMIYQRTKSMKVIADGVNVLELTQASSKNRSVYNLFTLAIPRAA